MFRLCLSLRAVASAANVNQYLMHLNPEEGEEVSPLSEVVPDMNDGMGEVKKFHSLMCETMKHDGINTIGIIVVPPTSEYPKRYRITEDLCAPLFSDTKYEHEGRVPCKRNRIYGVEPALAITLNSTPPASHNIENVMKHIDCFAPVIEFQATRFPYYAPNGCSFAADVLGHGRFVIGNRTPIAKLNGVALPQLSCVLTRDEEPVQVGYGRNCLGNPLLAVCAAARYSHETGIPLGAGSIVLCTGLSTKMTAPKTGLYECNFGPHGSVQAHLD